MRRVALVAILVLADAIAPAPAHAGDVGVASTWSGPGAATHDCRWPWTSCRPRTVRSLLTGRTITVTPIMFCDCYVGRIGPAGETARLVDLAPDQIAALGLPGPGLYDVEVTIIDAAVLPDTAFGIDSRYSAGAYSLRRAALDEGTTRRKVGESMQHASRRPDTAPPKESR